jgi:hypothetical protein
MSVDSSGTEDIEPPAKRQAVTIDGPKLFDKPPELKRLGGSQSDDWNNVIVNQTVNALWINEDQKESQFKAVASALFEINPRDPIEGMIGAQLLAGHNAAMECYRRAMLPGQDFEFRRENLNQAGKLSRTFATLLEALNRHRGKGQQKVVVEHVHVYKGGQAIVGHVGTPGGGLPPKLEVQTHATQIEDASDPPMRGTNTERKALPIAVDAKRPLPNARRPVARRAEGK